MIFEEAVYDFVVCAVSSDADDACVAIVECVAGEGGCMAGAFGVEHCMLTDMFIDGGFEGIPLLD